MSYTIDITSGERARALELLTEGRALNVKGEFAAAIAKYVESLVISQEIGDIATATQTFIQVGNVYMNQSEFSEARNVFTDALGLASSIEYKAIMSSCYNSIGNALGSMADYDKAIENYRKGLELALQIGDKKTEGRFYSNLSAIYVRQGNYAKTLEYLLLCLRIWGDSGDKNVLQMVYINLADAYSKLKNYEDAESNALHAINLSTDTGNKMMLSQGYLTLASIYFAENKLEAALHNFNSALDIKLEIGDKDGAATCYNGIGNIHSSRGEYNEALKQHTKALNLFTEVESKSGIVSSLNHIGNSHLHLNNYEESEKNLQQGVKLGLQLGYKESISAGLFSLYKLKKQMGDMVAALEHYEKHVAVSNEMHNKDVAMQMSNMRTNYDLEIKDKEKHAVEKILHNILPVSIANRIKNGEEKIIERFSDVSVLFADMVGFTTWSDTKNVDEVAAMLDRLFGIFDRLTLIHGVEKIKTIGDSYMCVAGLPEPCEDHAERLAKMAIDMQDAIKNEFENGEIRVRIGIHRGEVIAGIIGKNKYAFDLWGDTVNIASRMESHGEADRIQVSVEFRDALTGKFEFEERGEISIKGKDKHTTFFLLHSLG